MAQRSFGRVETRSATHVNEGLRIFMQKVFATMGLGLSVTGLVAYFVASEPAIYMPILTTPLRWVLLLATLAVPLTVGMGIRKLSHSTARTLFWVYAILMGASLSSILLAYTTESVARVFLITACMFGGMSLYGYVTKNDLSRYGSFLFMGLLGVILASVVNLFIGSTPLQLALSVITVLVFTGLTAYDVQMIKGFYRPELSEAEHSKFVTLSALNLYLDFINIFLAMMRLFGDRR